MSQQVLLAHEIGHAVHYFSAGAEEVLLHLTGVDGACYPLPQLEAYEADAQGAAMAATFAFCHSSRDLAKKMLPQKSDTVKFLFEAMIATPEVAEETLCLSEQDMEALEADPPSARLWHYCLSLAVPVVMSDGYDAWIDGLTADAQSGVKLTRDELAAVLNGEASDYINCQRRVQLSEVGIQMPTLTPSIDFVG